jgi:hypothetical protein
MHIWMSVFAPKAYLEDWVRRVHADKEEMAASPTEVMFLPCHVPVRAIEWPCMVQERTNRQNARRMPVCRFANYLGSGSHLVKWPGRV